MERKTPMNRISSHTFFEFIQAKKEKPTKQAENGKESQPKSLNFQGIHATRGFAGKRK